MGRDAIEGTDCAVIEGERAMGGTVRLWIDVQALALVRESKATKFDAAWRADNVERMRRALANMAPDDEDHAMMKRMVADQERATPMDFRTESVTVWHPEFDVEIDESSFAFTPPA